MVLKPVLGLAKPDLGDAALFPRGAGVAEVAFGAEGGVYFMVKGELGFPFDCLPAAVAQDRFARCPFVGDEDELAVLAEGPPPSRGQAGRPPSVRGFRGC